MPLNYGYATGSSIESKSYTLISDLLEQLPDNNNNDIFAKHVRNSVFTLWERIDGVSTILGGISSTNYINPNATLVSVGGIAAGSTFATPQTVQSMFDRLLYPYLTPVISLSSVSKQYGEPLSTILNWSVTKKSNNITGVTVGNIPQSGITGNSQNGSQILQGTYSISNTPVSTINSFTMSVVDTQPSTVNTNGNITWMNKVYWGTINLSDMIPANPDLTLTPASAQAVGLHITDLKIRTLSNSTLSTVKERVINGIGGDGKYLIFAWPSSVSNPETPLFNVGGFNSSAFTKVRSASTFYGAFVNQFGFTTNYEVWVSNTIYNSATNVIISNQ